MSTIKARFEVLYTQILNNLGECIGPLPSFAQDQSTLIHLYENMVRARLFDKKAIALQRTGKIGTYAPINGQEAISTAIGHAMHPNDVFAPYYRDYAAQFQRGVKMSDILSYWGGDERGSQFDNISEDLPICVPIASQCLHAAGIAFAFKYRQQPRVAVVCLGDGGTSEGDFYEAMNVAGAWNLPVVFVINNNQWAISVAREKQTHCQTLAQKAIAAGIEGMQVDGNDIIAVRYLTELAIAKARNEQRPSLIEALTFRLCDHTTADDAKRYVPTEQFDEALKKEPFIRFERFLRAQHYLTDTKQMEITGAVNLQIEQAVQTYLNTPPYEKTDIIDYMYEKLPMSLLDQRDDIREEI